MAKTKKITFNMINEIIADNETTEIVLDEGKKLSLTVKRFLDFDEAIGFVHSIADSCFNDYGDYMPEAFDFAVCVNVLMYYAGVQTPTDFDKTYRVYAQNNFMDDVFDAIDYNQLHVLLKAADERIEYKKTVLAQANVGKMAELIESIDRMVSDSKATMEEVNSPEFQATLGNMLRALGQNSNTESKDVPEGDTDNIVVFRKEGE